jgi:serine/threonine-protein phosphatase 2B catalytic subunit
LFTDILWSDPVEMEDGTDAEVFRSNPARGCSYLFSVEAVNAFLKRNNLLSIIRAHEAQLEGYKLHKWNGDNEFPAVITIFSAPNYCDVYKNKGAVIKFQNNKLNIQQYDSVGHPYILPDFKDIFSWSVPFVAVKALAIMKNIMIPKRNEVE